jgi:hypothetical protein
MSYLERLKRRNMPTTGTDKTDRSPFVSFVSTQGRPFRGIEDREAMEERAAIYEFDAGLTREDAEMLAGVQ